MIFSKVFLCLIITVLSFINSQSTVDDLRFGWKRYYPCEKTKNIFYYSEAVNSNDKEFSFFMGIEEELTSDSIINITFALPVVFNKSNSPTAFYFSRRDKINVHLMSSQKKLSLRLKTYNGRIPELESVLIDNVECCKGSNSDIEEKIITLLGFNQQFYTENREQSSDSAAKINCGMRKRDYVSLISHGKEALRGDWPWHVAIFRREGAGEIYICGGTLISKNLVLTALHCTIVGNSILTPRVLRVSLGQHNLAGANEIIQKSQVSAILVPKGYNTITKDIALLKLTTLAVFNDYVQPACLWRSEFSKFVPAYSEILGTVVGWGLDLVNGTSSVLKQADIPRISNVKCIKSNEHFFLNKLNGTNFCAGWRNRTTSCNGDSGGGFMVNIATDDGVKRWHVQGITSHAVSQNNICDPDNYVVYTDVAKFCNWIDEYL